MDMFVVYSVCFAVLYITPASLFLRRLKIAPALKELKNLTVSPQFDKENNAVSVKNNFSDFSSGLEKAARGSYPYKILRRVCEDSEKGKSCNPAFYLSLYKNHCGRFLGNLFLASHIAPFVVLTAAKFLSLPFENFLDRLILFQFVWYFLIAVLRLLLARNFDMFTEIFYREWYNKLLNFDAISIDALKDTVFKDFVSAAEINKTVSNLRETFSAPLETLSSSIPALASALEEAGGEKQKGALVTAESVIASFDASFKRIELLCKNLENAAALSEESYKELHTFAGANKDTINAINTLAGEFSALRTTLAGHISASENAAIEKLGGVTTALENNVNKMFAAMQETLNTNTQELSKTYERFFDICKTISEGLTEEEV
jgi:hypothetical protein